MTKLKLYIFVFGILASLNLKSQYSNIFEKKDDVNCLKIKIIDKKLISVIDSFINTIKDIDENFKKRGYITIKMIKKKNENIPSIYNLESCHYINFSYTQFFITDDLKNFPKFYSYINDKLILFFEDSNFSEFSKRQINLTKKKYIRLTKKYIEKPKFITILDSSANRIKLQNLGSHGFGAGFYFCYPQNDIQNPFIYKPLIY